MLNQDVYRLAQVSWYRNGRRLLIPITTPPPNTHTTYLSYNHHLPITPTQYWELYINWNNKEMGDLYTEMWWRYKNKKYFTIVWYILMFLLNSITQTHTPPCSFWLYFLFFLSSSSFFRSGFKSPKYCILLTFLKILLHCEINACMWLLCIFTSTPRDFLRMRLNSDRTWLS